MMRLYRSLCLRSLVPSSSTVNHRNPHHGLPYFHLCPSHRLPFSPKHFPSALIVNGKGSKHLWGSKTDIQISSHAQKYFLKVQKNGRGEHVPPPQPKSKAAHHYPQEAAKNAPVASQVTGPFQSSGAVHDSRCIRRPDSLSRPENLIIFVPSVCWTCNSVPSVNVSHITKDEVGVMRQTTTQNCYRSRSNESSPKMPVKCETNYQGKGKLSKPWRALIVNGKGSKHLSGSKTDIQISSHAQKYFLKVQKNGKGEHVPPPQPKSKAAHHYPQEVAKNAPVASQVTGPFQSSGAVHDSRCVLRPDSLSRPENLIIFAPSACWACNSVPSVNVSHITKDEVGVMRPTTTQNCYWSRSNESSPKMPVKRETNYQGKGKLSRPWRGLNMLGRGFCSESDSRVGEIFESKHLKHLEKIYNKQIGPPNIEMSRKQYLDIFAKLSRSEFPNFLKWVEKERVRVSSGPHVLGRKPIGRVGWLRPPTDFVKINTDGSYKDGMGGGGVVFRDSQGLVVRMYAVTFRKMRDELETELEAMHLGLFLANRFGYKNIVLESDHADLIRAIKSGKDVPDALFDQFQALPFHLVDDYEASYIPREGNKVADILSKYARLKSLWNNQKEGFRIALEQNSVDLQRLPYYRVEKEQEQQKESNGEKKTIWVSRLRDWMDDDYLHRCFVSTGEVKSARVIRNRETGLSAGYGFVEFFSHAAADKVLQSFAGKAMPDTGEPFHLNWAKY